MSKKHYPSWRYHKSEPAKIIHSEAEHEALGDEWKQSPADHEMKEEVEQVEAPVVEEIQEADQSQVSDEFPAEKKKKGRK